MFIAMAPRRRPGRLILRARFDDWEEVVRLCNTSGEFGPLGAVISDQLRRVVLDDQDDNNPVVNIDFQDGAARQVLRLVGLGS